MNIYESVVIVNKNIRDIDNFINLVKDIINKKGKVTNIEDRGNRELAYELHGQKEGRYILIDYVSKPEINKKLEDLYRKKTDVLKYIIIKGEE